MKRLIMHIAMFCAMALAVLSVGIVSVGQAQADGPAEKLELTCQYPVLSSYAGLSYSFDVSLNYTGTGSKIFDLKATVPPGFNASITPGYGGEGKEIAAIRLDGTKGYADSVKISLTPYAFKVPAPGSYPVSLTVSSGDLSQTIKLTAIVTANFDLKISTPDGRLNTEATSGQDTNMTIDVANTGTGDLEKVEVICMAKDRPSGWTVTTKPDKIDLIKAGETKEVQVTIHPSEKTISGDYSISIQAQPESKIAFANIQIRVTALTSTLWQTIGVVVVVLVVIALAVMFIRFGRR